MLVFLKILRTYLMDGPKESSHSICSHFFVYLFIFCLFKSAGSDYSS